MPQNTPTQAVALTDFPLQYDRVFDATGCKTQAQLADVLGIRQSSISDAKRRKSIPAEWLLKLFDKKRINPEWIRSGLGSIFLQITEAGEVKAPEVINVVELRPAEDCTTDALLAELVRRALKTIG
ncbi:helix-turn-helix domain-containing protein [Desulfovibrio sp.]|uniref:helix-turn-helix domain-containing protein n=1 Tax=Desulfovibrio sp. TaxID=885 RepID=UPI0025C1EFDF|nr:helix-turn-helix domain-containing protein [Desulfovibrio sp.]